MSGLGALRRMNVCPFCKASVRDPNAPCPACGRRASEHAALQMGGGRTLDSAFGDDDFGGDLELSRGGSIGSHAGPSAYAGGGLSLDDDDPFADDVPAGSLELDLPAHEAAKRAAPAPTTSGVPAGPPPAIPAVPDLALPNPPPSNPSLPAAPSAPSMPAAAQPPASHPAFAAQPPASHPAFAAHAAQPPASHPAFAAAPSSQPVPSQPAPSQPAPSQPAPTPAAPTPRQPPDPAALIARYPAPPDKLWETPAYAMKVLLRQLELRQDLASLRRKRSPDVPLYERALRTHDPKSFALGLILTCAGLAIASFLFFLPVIIRFLRDPY